MSAAEYSTKPLNRRRFRVRLNGEVTSVWGGMGASWGIPHTSKLTNPPLISPSSRASKNCPCKVERETSSAANELASAGA